MEASVQELTPDAAVPGARAQRGGGPTFAIAFGGGGARGLSHIHVIEALDELGVVPTAISGSSIGAIMGAGMAAGMSGRDIHGYARSILCRRAEVAARMWRARPGSFGEMLAGGVGFSQFNVERILNSFLPDAIPATFEQLKIPLAVTATDYYQHKQCVFQTGSLKLALAASAAIPAVFRPVRHEGRFLIDGGISNPVPFDLLEGKADILIAIDVVGAPTDDVRRRPNSIDLMFGASQIMMQSIIALKLQRTRPQIMLRPPVSRFRVLDFLKIDHVMAETASIKDELKQAIEAAVERVDRQAAE
jgi:NTE family protein